MDLPDPGIEPGSSALQADSLPAELPGVLISYLYFRTLLIFDAGDLKLHF